MSLSYQYSVGVNKPLQTQLIASASSRIANTGFRTWTYTDGTALSFVSYNDDVPADNDYIVIMADTDNYLMKAASFAATYKVVA